MASECVGWLPPTINVFLPDGGNFCNGGNNHDAPYQGFHLLHSDFQPVLVPRMTTIILTDYCGLIVKVRHKTS
jgi:hypothetical protein